MPVTESHQDYRYEKLLKEMQDLHSRYDLLMSSYDEEVRKRTNIENDLVTRNEVLLALNQYSISLSQVENKKVPQFIVDEFKNLFQVRAVWISRYDEKLSELIVQASTVNDNDNTILSHHIGKSIQNLRIQVDDEMYRFMITNGISNKSSLHEISLGQISQKAGTAIQKLFGIGWFQGVALNERGKLFGTLVVAGHKDQDPLKKESLVAFSELTSNILRRIQSEEKLVISEEKFRKAFITSPDAVNINRLEDGMYVAINDGFTKISGYPEEEVVGKTSSELNIWVNAEDRAKLVKLLREKGVVENLESVFKMKNGTIRNGMMSATIIDLNDVPHILSITRDVTDKKNAALALSESENRYRELIELAVDGILVGAPDGKIISANSYMQSLTGRSLDLLLNLNISSLFTADDLEKIPLRFDLLQQGKTVINERHILRSDGKTVPVEMHTKMMPDGRYQSIFHDISERKEAEKALQEREEWFRNLFEQSNDGIIYIASDGSIVTANLSFAEMHGYTIPEILKMKITDLDCPETGQYYQERMERLSKGDGMKFEVEHFHRNGSRIPLEVTAGKIAVGSLDYIMASHRDITERLKVDEAMKIAREKAEASDRLKTSFLNNISHEVRTPLNGILGFADIISNGNLTEEDKMDALAMVNESSNRLLETITNYMDISLLVSGEITVKRSIFSPGKMLNDLYFKFLPVCESKKINLLLCIPEFSDKHLVNSDPELIKKIVVQLLNNAVKFTEEGTIEFGYIERKGKIEYFISDTGIGIEKEFLDSVFNYFVKEDQIKSRPTEGSGLGLSISKGLVALLGDELKVDTQKGFGSRFYFSIPLINYIEEESTGKYTKVQGRVNNLSVILVAEDDEANFRYIKAVLDHSTKAEIIHAVNGREAIEKFTNNPGIDMVLMDMKMPEINGIEATKMIKSMNHDVPVIAMTAYAMHGDESRIIEAGCDGYLSKPINKKDLIDKIKEFIRL